MKKYIFAGLGILIVLTIIIVFGFNGITRNAVKEVNTQSTNINFEEMCKNDGKEWMKMMPMINGVPTGNPACYGCMVNEDTHFCDKEEYLAFVDKDHDLIINSVREAPTQKNLETANLEIEGMTCQSCALGVEYELKQVNGVADAKINYQDGTGTVTFDPTIVDAETIAKASTVYPAKVVK